MYRLLIVDDEKTTRDSLQAAICWSQLGIAEVLTAKNGIEALELAKTNQPDIILTDIRMPKMDGLQLAERLREQFPECQIIFLTGYADKEYLKTAIQLNAVSYIEKPIHLPEIQEVIQKTVALCDKAMRQNQTLSKLQNNLNASKPLLRQALTLELIDCPADGLLEREKYAELGFPLSNEQCYTLVNLNLFWEPNLPLTKIAHYQQTLLNRLFDTHFAAAAQFTAGFNSTGNLIIIVAQQNEARLTDSQLPLKALWQQLVAITEGHCRFAAGVGKIAHGYTEIPQAYQNAVAVAARQFYAPAQPIFDHADPYASSTLEISKSLFTDFKTNLREDRFKAALDLIKDLTRQLVLCRDPDLNRVKNIYFHLLLVIYEVALERGLIDPFDAREERYIWKELEEKKHLDELSGYLSTTLDLLFNQLSESDAANRKIQEIVRYIRRHYADKTLSIQSLSTQVYLSPTYLCAFFKKSTGKTLNEFITETRIAKAKELLNNAQLKLYEIATQVGFTDVNYFSTLFKRYVGCTPTEFREKYYR